jgi:hypothetical protein
MSVDVVALDVQTTKMPNVNLNSCWTASRVALELVRGSPGMSEGYYVLATDEEIQRR